MRAQLLCCLAVAVAVPGMAPAATGQSVLSPAQQAVVDKTFAKMSAADKQIVAKWSDGKKLAEFFCTKPGLAAIRKQERTADRVFLGPDDDGVKKFVLTGNTQLSGRGTVRIRGGWKDFTFVCDLDPGKAAVKSFTFKFEAP